MQCSATMNGNPHTLNFLRIQIIHWINNMMLNNSTKLIITFLIRVVDNCHTYAIIPPVLIHCMRTLSHRSYQWTKTKLRDHQNAPSPNLTTYMRKSIEDRCLRMSWMNSHCSQVQKNCLLTGRRKLQPVKILEHTFVKVQKWIYLNSPLIIMCQIRETFFLSIIEMRVQEGIVLVTFV